ncbi:MAG: hypothetical protein PQJ46_12205, partial [Spirochaetales bacterium]|nr:hypothetical protein [Spirochaetales bacterium]
MNKKEYRPNNITRIIAAVVMFFFCGTIFGQTVDSVILEQESLFDRYLDRADMSRERAEWQRMAAFGIEAVTAEWEKNTETVISDEQRSEVTKLLSSKADQRYKQWLVDCFFSKLPTPGGDELLNAIKDANEKYLFLYNDDGSLQRDESGDLILQKVDGIEDDLSSWQEIVNTGKATSFDSFLNNEGQLADEFYIFLGNDNEALFSGELFSARFNLYKDSYEKELEQLVQYAQERFYLTRSYDQYSLRKKTESESASAIAVEQIAGARTRLEKAISQLKSSLSAVDDNTTANKSEISSEEWKENFRQAFNSGMTIWEEAENKLLANRLEWEQSAENDIEEGEAVWAEAFEKIQQEQKKWQQELRDIINDGKQEWAEKESDFYNMLEEASQELDASITAQTQSLENQIDGIIDILIKSTDVLQSVNASIEYWNEHSDDPDFTDSIEFWKNTKLTYEKYITNSEEKLAKMYGVILGKTLDELTNTGKNTEAITEDDMLGSNNIANWEYRYLDAYQVQLVKSELLKQYWDRQVEIAQDVYNYANDTSSERPQESETLSILEEKTKELNNSKASYDAALEDMKQSGDILNADKQDIDEKKATLSSLQQQLEEARLSYQNALDRLIASEPKDYTDEMESYYSQLLSKAGIAAGNNVTDEQKAYNEYIAAVDAYDRANGYLSLNDKLYQLVTGSDTGTTADSMSLEELKNIADSAAEWEFKAEDLDWSRLGLSSDDNLVSQLLQEQEWYNNSLSETERDYLLFRINAWAEYSRNSTLRDYSMRIEEARLLASNDYEGWIKEINGLSPDSTEEFNMAEKLYNETPLFYSDLVTFNGSNTELLKYLADTAKGRYIYQRAVVAQNSIDIMRSIEQELDSLYDTAGGSWDNFIKDMDWMQLKDKYTSEENRAAQAAWAVIYDRIVNCGYSLNQMQQLISENELSIDKIKDYFTITETEKLDYAKLKMVGTDELRTLIAEDSLVADYISGNSELFQISISSKLLPSDNTSNEYYTQASLSCSYLNEYLFGDYTTEYRLAVNRGQIIDRYSSTHPGLIIARRTAAKNALRVSLNNAGLIHIKDNGWEWNGVDSMYTKYKAMTNKPEIEDWLADMQLDITDSCSGLSNELISIVNDAVTQSVNYAVLYAIKDGIIIHNDFGSEKLKKMSADLSAMQQLNSALATVSNSSSDSQQKAVMLVKLYNQAAAIDGQDMQPIIEGLNQILSETLGLNIASSIFANMNSQERKESPDRILAEDALEDFFKNNNITASDNQEAIIDEIMDLLTRAMVIELADAGEYSGGAFGSLSESQIKTMLQQREWNSLLGRAVNSSYIRTSEDIACLKELYEDLKNGSDDKILSHEEMDKYLCERFAAGDDGLYNILNNSESYTNLLKSYTEEPIFYNDIEVPQQEIVTISDDLLDTVFGTMSLVEGVTSWIKNKISEGSLTSISEFRNAASTYIHEIVDNKDFDADIKDGIITSLMESLNSSLAEYSDDEMPDNGFTQLFN